MKSNSIGHLIDDIKKMLNKESENVAEVLKILDKFENIKLNNAIAEEAVNIDIDLEEIKMKITALLSLANVLEENPNIRRILEAEQNKRDIVKAIYNNIFKICINFNGYIKDMDEKVYFSTIQSLVSLISDNGPIADVLVRQSIDKYSKTISSYDLSIDKVKNMIYLLIMKLTCRIFERKDIDKLKALLESIEQMFYDLQVDKAQDEELEINDVMKIGVLGNIIYVLKGVVSYILNGKIVWESEVDISTFIDTYSFNSLKLAKSTENTELITISTLLPRSMKQLCKNSIWNFADKSPAIRKFFEKCLESDSNLIYTLLPSQRDSILEVLSNKKSVVLNMPTSSGKTLLAELYIIYTLYIFRENDESIKPTVAYVAPTNALVNQVRRELSQKFEGFGYRIETALPFYNMDEIEEEILGSHVDILITTPEKLDFLVRKNHSCIRNLKLVVMDEAHNIKYEERGSKFELLLATIKQRKKDVNYLLLSPFIKNPKELAEWLGDSQNDSVSITINWSPTKQYVGCNLIKDNKTKSIVKYYPTPRNNILKDSVEIDLHVNPTEKKKELECRRIDYKLRAAILIEKYIKLGSVLVVCRGADTCESYCSFAFKYLKNQGLIKNKEDDESIQKAIELVKFEMDENDQLIEYLKYGMAFHHAKMPDLVKEIVEELISDKKIDIVFATTTLGQGMNFPITTLIFAGLVVGKRETIDTTTFWNFAGRAGRAYMDKEGHIIVMDATNKADDVVEKEVIEYIKKDAEEIMSSLTKFFNAIDDDFKIDYNYIKQNPAMSNFIQYLNHILNVSYNYNIEDMNAMKIRSILNSCLLYRQLEYTEGFMEAQQKVADFSFKYIEHLKGVEKKQLKLADLFGVSDVSFNMMRYKFLEYKNSIEILYSETDRDKYLKTTKIILDSKDPDKLKEIVEIINVLPELKLELTGSGRFNPWAISHLIIGWVNGRKISDIASEIKYENTPTEVILRDCYKFVNGSMKRFVPWGISMYQAISGDLSGEDAKYLPSYIYYGVNDVESVILSKIGVPRFAVKTVKKILKDKYPEIIIDVKNIARLKKIIPTINDDEYKNDFFGYNEKIIKKIIDERI